MAMNGESTARALTPPADGGPAARRDVTVANPQGLHLRPAATFAKLARQFPGTVSVLRNGQSVNGKSQLDLLLLAAEPNSVLTVEVTGPDAELAVELLAGLLANPNSDEIE
jgi:phosphotransferase system HPr (HPr) family protein